MPKSLNSLAIKHLDDQLARWRTLAHTSVPHGGWLRAVRQTLGLTAAQLGRRIGVTQQAVAEFERNEAAGKITLHSLERVAAALGCKLAYAVVPQKPLAEMRLQRARELADSLVKPVAHSMKLEAQGVSKKEMRRKRDELADELLRGSSRKLWQ